jgi:hypothetical protein
MADKKISALNSSTTPLAGTEELPIVQSGATTKVSVDNLTAGKNVSVKGISFDSLGGIRTFDWGNVSSIAQDLSTLFGNVSFGSRSLSLLVQVRTESSSSNATSATFVALKSSNNTWAFSAVTSATVSGATITPSGSSNTLTLSFSSGGQFGVALVQLI